MNFGGWGAGWREEKRVVNEKTFTFFYLGWASYAAADHTRPRKGSTAFTNQSTN